MRRLQAPISVFCALLTLSSTAAAQTASAVRIEPAKGGLGWLTRPYQARYVPPVNLTNSARLESLVRAGNLYLSSQDVVALAIENNLDVEVQRYGPLLAQEVLRRAKGGGALRDVGVTVAQGPTSVSLTGVSVNASGGGTTGAAGTGVSSGGGIVTQLGPPIQSFDPTFSLYTNFAHTTTPQSNTFITGTTALIIDTRQVQAQYVHNWQFGLNAQLTYSSNHEKFNSSFYDVNPFTAGNLDLQISQNLLYGFGSAVNGRNIRVQRNNIKVTDLQFKQQVITTTSAILDLYWDLVSFTQAVRTSKHELETAQQLFNDNKKQVEIGTLAPIEVTRAESQVYTAQQDLLIAQTNLLQQETVLKNSLSRNGVASPTIAEVHIVPLETISVPEKDEFKPLDELVQQALTTRVEIAESELNIVSNKLNLVGIKNSLRPTLQVFTELTNNGLSGQLSALGALNPTDAYLSGGYGNLLAQIFRRNYPSYSAGFSLNIPIRNRAAQSDYATSELQIRQSELNLQKQRNQIRVDVQNAVIGLQQARARYDSSVKARVLQQQTLDAERKKYTLGASTVFAVIQDQRDLATAESNEVQALANYSHARISFDQALGTTLEINHISLEEALAGKVSRPSGLPDKLPSSPVDDIVQTGTGTNQ